MRVIYIRSLILLILCIVFTQYLSGQANGAGSLMSTNELAVNNAPVNNEVELPPTIKLNRGLTKVLSAEYTVQVGAFSHRQNAVKLSNKFKTAGFKVNIYTNYLDGKPLLFLVWVGSYKSFDDVASAQRIIKIAYNIDGVIRERSVWPR
jgi:cell division protein FtsN